MTPQEIVNAISVLSACLDAFTRAGAVEQAEVVINKLLDLIARL